MIKRDLESENVEIVILFIVLLRLNAVSSSKLCFQGVGVRRQSLCEMTRFLSADCEKASQMHSKRSH